MTMFTFLFLLMSGVGASFTSCDLKTALVFTELTAVPDSRVVAGQPISLRFAFNLSEGQWIPGGSIRIKTSLNYFPLSSYTESFCDRFHCPLMAGVHEFVYSDVFPSLVWGRVNTDIIVTNTSGVDLLCARLTVKS